MEILNPGCSSSVMAAPPTVGARLEHERLHAAPREDGGRRQAVVPAADEDDVGHLRISSAALRPGAPMMPPPGCVADPHIYRLPNRRAVLRPSGNRPQEQQLLERQLALKDVALAQPPFALEIERSDDLAVQDQRLQIRRVLGERVDHGIAEALALVIPGRAVQVIRRVLHEARHHVLAGRRHRRVREAGNDDIHIGPF